MKSRGSAVFRLEISTLFRRPVFFIFILILTLMAYGLSIGDVRIQSGDAQVGGTKAWITSEFSQSMILSILMFLFYLFFISVVAGTAVQRDDDCRISPLLHATPLTAAEYILGKFTAIILFFTLTLGLHTGLTVFFNHIVPHADTAEVIGPFVFMNYLGPLLLFGLPAILFISGFSFYLGVRTRHPALVFFIPVIFLMVCAFFLWNWSPSWLDLRINKILMVADPAGFRWLNETYLKADRGVEFYNNQRLQIDSLFLANRAWVCMAGILGAGLSVRRFKKFQGSESRKVRSKKHKISPGTETVASPDTLTGYIPIPGISRQPAGPFHVPGLLRSTVFVFRNELKELKSQAGLFLFIPLIMLQAVGSGLSAQGAFDTSVLTTPGSYAVRSMNTLTLLICLLILFYTVESLMRERNTGSASLIYPTPVPTGSLLLGKTLANSAVAVLILAAMLIAGWIIIVVQGKVAFSVQPFLVVWGLLLIPTFVFWAALTAFIFSMTRNRYTTYGICLGLMILSGFMQLTGRMTWIWNWNLWDAVVWSDMGILDLDRYPLILNRIHYISLAILFSTSAVAIFRRRETDALRILNRANPARIMKAVFRWSPLILIPVLTACLIWKEVRNGFQGSVTDKMMKDYWRRNVATWKDAPLPDIQHISMNVELFPDESRFRTEGYYSLKNCRDRELKSIPVTASPLFKNLTWSLNGSPVTPKNQSALYILTPEHPLKTGDTIRIGFSFEGRQPSGASKNGGGLNEFILPSGVVLTCFSGSFTPLLGFQEDWGVDEENRADAREYDMDFYEGITEPMIGSPSPFTLEMNVTAPSEYIVNSVGILTGQEESSGRTCWHWKSDYPVRFYNITAGRWSSQEKGRCRVYYHAEHEYNVPDMLQTLNDALEQYSDWFGSYPWKELKISEFPGYSSYAQGFPTHIPFSENIGFLTQAEPGAEAAFVVTAHEASHQWWANILTPGKGPSGNLCAEGMAHYSTMLLLQKIKGDHARMEFCRRIEHEYAEDRQTDSELPLVRVDGSRPGDTAVMYDKASWVFWMIDGMIGRDRMLTALQELIRRYGMGPDYPVLEDHLHVFREYAPDPGRFDRFADAWCRKIIFPEFKLTGCSKEKQISENGGEAGWKTMITIRQAGSGDTPVDIAVCRGDRFDDKGHPESGYLETRTFVELVPGVAQTVELTSDFEPDRIVVDPDVNLLQNRRKYAEYRF